MARRKPGLAVVPTESLSHKAPHEDVPVKLWLHPKVVDHIDRLVASGYWGVDRTACAERLLCDRLVQLLREDGVQIC